MRISRWAQLVCFSLMSGACSSSGGGSATNASAAGTSGAGSNGCTADCAKATCSTPGDRCGGECSGVCQPYEVGCTDDLTCGAGFACIARADGSNLCLPSDCAFRVLAPPLCGSPGAKCGDKCPDGTLPASGGVGGSLDMGIGGSSNGGGSPVGGSQSTSFGGSDAGSSGTSASGSSGSGGTSPFAVAYKDCTGSVTSSAVHTFTNCQFALAQEKAEPYYYVMQISAVDASGHSLSTELEFVTVPAVGAYDSSSLSNYDINEVFWHESGIDYEAEVSADFPTPFGSVHVDITTVSGPFIAGGTVSYYLVDGTLTATALDVTKTKTATVSITF